MFLTVSTNRVNSCKFKFNNSFEYKNFSFIIQFLGAKVYSLKLCHQLKSISNEFIQGYFLKVENNLNQRNSILNQ